jgi:hypothetical protein
MKTSALKTGRALARSFVMSALIGFVASPLSATTYGGRASTAEVTVDASLQLTTPLIWEKIGPVTVGVDSISICGPIGAQTVMVNSTGDLPREGGQIVLSLLALSAVNNCFQAEAARAHTSGSSDVSYSENFVTRGVVKVDKYCITFDAVSSWAGVSRYGDDVPGEPEIGGYSRILNLSINGCPLGSFEPPPNKSVKILCGDLAIILNEHDTHLNSTTGSITVTAMRIVVSGKADVKVATSHASIAP